RPSAVVARAGRAERRQPRCALCLRLGRAWGGARARPQQWPTGVEAGGARLSRPHHAAAARRSRGGRRLRRLRALPRARIGRLPRASEDRRGAARRPGAADRQPAGADRGRRPVCVRAVKPVIALVGRPNVGKSTLFNRLTRSRDAIVHDLPGVTRDRHYGEGRLGSRPFIAIDTGGFEPRDPKGIFVEMARQAEQAIVEADAVVFVVDGRAGLTPGDRAIAERLRRLKNVYLGVNKTEGMQPDTAVAEFHELGLGNPAAISAAHGEGVRELVDLVLARFPEADAPDEKAQANHPRVAVVGRPNVGKSTLVNALVGEERVIAFDQPGTTRDPIEVPFQRGGRRYTLIDTAGLRRRGKTGEAVEYFSI